MLHLKLVTMGSSRLPVPFLPGRWFPIGVVGCLKNSLARLGVDQIDLYQVHGYVHPHKSIESVAKGLAECVKLGLTKAVGVSNYNTQQMIRMYDGEERLTRRAW